MQDLRPPGSFSRDALGPTGTMVLGDGVATGLVFVARPLLARICEDAQTRARTGPHEHFEIGGLLVGPKSQNGDLRVEEAVPLGFEYRFGPSFPMLLAGLDSIDPAIAAIQQDGSKTVLGLYRILTRRDGALHATDLEMLAALESAPSTLPHFRCCFIAAPESGSEILLRVLVPNGGRWEQIQQITLHLDSAGPPKPSAESAPTEPSPQPAPELPEGNPAAAIGPPAAPAAPMPAAKRTPESPESGHRWPNITAVYWAAALILIALVAGLYWISQRYASAIGASRLELPPPAHTGFSANRDGSAWKLTWDSAAVEALKPTGATLSIQDGGSQQDIPLAAADLSSGAIYYTPKSGELAFRFEVRRDGATLAEERVRVVEGVKQGASSAASPAPQTASVVVSAPNGGSGGGSNSAGARAFSPPKSGAPSAAAAPILSEAGPIATTPVPQPPVSTVFKAPPPPPSPAPIQPQPAPPAASKKPDYVAPKALRRVEPQVQFVPRGYGTIQVAVLVAIDPKGRVTKVTPVGPIADVRLVAAATKAAQFWEFEPARLNGQAISSEMTLIFRF
jgi:TonB family protein